MVWRGEEGNQRPEISLPRTGTGDVGDELGGWRGQADGIQRAETSEENFGR